MVTKPILHEIHYLCERESSPHLGYMAPSALVQRRLLFCPLTFTVKRRLEHSSNLWAPCDFEMLVGFLSHVSAQLIQFLIPGKELEEVVSIFLYPRDQFHESCSHLLLNHSSKNHELALGGWSAARFKNPVHRLYWGNTSTATLVIEINAKNYFRLQQKVEDLIWRPEQTPLRWDSSFKAFPEPT